MPTLNKRTVTLLIVGILLGLYVVPKLRARVGV